MESRFEMRIVNHSADVKQTINQRIVACLEECGLRAESYAKMKAPVGTTASTHIVGYNSSGLRNSITHKVVESEKRVVIGTNNKTADGKPYPAFVEFGTGVYAADGKGRKTPWIWIDKNGDAHKTKGRKPVHYMRNAIADHVEEYQQVIRKHLGG